MSRVKRGVAASKRRNYLLKRAKGFKGLGGNIFRIAKQRLFKAESNAYISRRLKKRDFRSLWISRINGALDTVGSELNYSRFINLINKSELKLNRKMLSEIAIVDIEAFKSIVSQVSNQKLTPSKKVETKESKPAKSTKKEESQDSELKVDKVALVSEAVNDIEEKINVEEVTSKLEKTSSKSNSKADDLKIVEGVGPAIEKLLHEADITTYSQLAETEYDKLKEILSNAGSRFSIHDPLNWSKQAKLASEGKFEELETLKDQLVNGK
jgi:large subunit ribosomal protein L20